MLTGTTLDTVLLLALIALVHVIVSSFIATKLTEAEKSATETNKTNTQAFVFDRIAANDQFRKAA